MAKIKLTKGELKSQRDSLKQFRHYLPTLQLKKQQLQMKIMEAREQLKAREAVLAKCHQQVALWQGLLAEPGVDLSAWVIPEKCVTTMVNIAGANVPMFQEIIFPEASYDFYAMPLWIDRGLEQLRKMMALLAEVAVIKKGIMILQKELRVTTQRVNLFEKIKIPECLDNIRVIRIYLGDQQSNAVGIGKVAKKKLEDRQVSVEVMA